MVEVMKPNRGTNNNKIAVGNADLCGKICDMHTVVKYAAVACLHETGMADDDALSWSALLTRVNQCQRDVCWTHSLRRAVPALMLLSHF